jgi:hypothetical protein
MLLLAAAPRVLEVATIVGYEEKLNDLPLVPSDWDTIGGTLM